MAVETIAYTPAVPSAAVAQGREGTTHASGQTLFKRGISDATATNKTAFECQRDALQFSRMWYLMPFMCEQVSGVALTVGVSKGQYRKSDGTAVEFAGNAAFVVPDATTAYLIWIEIAGNALAGDVAWPADITTFIPIAELDTAGGAIVEGSIKSRLTLLQNQINASSTSPTGTTGTAFTMDSDNAGAEATQQLRFNRGSTDAEDAAVEWDAANDKFNLRTQHTTGTLAPVNVLKVQISGTDALDSNGAAKVAAAVAGDGLTHSAGVLAVNPDGTTLEISADAVRIKDAGVSVAKLNDALADKLVQISIPDATGASPRTVSIQAKDIQGNNLAEVVYLQVGVYQDADGAANASNATIAVGATGTLVRSVTATKVLIVKTNASGVVDIAVTDGTLETVYVLAAPAPRSKLLDCSDIGTVVIA